MARLESSTRTPLLVSQLNHPLVLVVDMVNGFAKEGALADPAIAAIAEDIRRLIEQSQADVLFVNDAHDPQAVEFSAFPPHCLKGSEEGKIIEELAMIPGSRFEKNCISAAAADGFFERISSYGENRDLIVTGCCTDLCILQCALPLQSWISQNNRRDLRVIVPETCVETYHVEGIHDAFFWNKTALEIMEANGVTIVSSIDQ